MTFLALGASAAALLVAVFWLYAVIRAKYRAIRIEGRYPPTGQFLTIAGKKLHYTQRGQGPDVVLIHGASGNFLDMTTALLSQLEENFRVTAFDRPGLGWSEGLADLSLAAQATHLAKAAQSLGLRDPVVVGQSYGGAVALAWGLQSILRPKALVLIGAPALPWPGKLGPWYRVTKTWLGRTIAVPLASAFVSDAYLRKTIADIFAPCPVPAQYHEKICAALTLRMKTLGVNLKQVNGLRQELVQMAPHYASLTLPIRLIHGTADTIVPLAIHAAPLIKMLPNAELTVIQNGGHMPHFSHTDLVIDAIVKASSTPILRAAGVSPS